MQTRGDFHVGKKGVGLQDILHAPTLRRAFFGLTITKKGVIEVVEGVCYFGMLSVKLRSPLESFSPGMGPPKPGIFF